MKHCKCIIGSMFLMGICLHAQPSIEIQGGLNIANLSNPGNLVPGAIWKARIGFVGIASANFTMTEDLLFSPGLRFVQKGTKSEWWLGATGSVEATVTNNYMDLPLYLKYQVVDFGLKVFMVGGASFSYLLSSRTEGTTQKYGYTSANTKHEYKSYDFSFDIGLAAQTSVTGKVAFVVSGIYSHGSVNIHKSDSNEQTRDIRLTIGILYPLNI